MVTDNDYALIITIIKHAAISHRRESWKEQKERKKNNKYVSASGNERMNECNDGTYQSEIRSVCVEKGQNFPTCQDPLEANQLQNATKKGRGE